MIKPVNVADVTTALLGMLRNDTRLAGVAIERAAVMNTEPLLNGWVGVYRQMVEYPSRALGRGAGYRQQRIHLVVLVQHSHNSSGEECEDRLEELLQIVNSVILSDETLAGTVEVLDDFRVRYESYEKVGATFMQTALVQFVGLIPVGIY